MDKIEIRKSLISCGWTKGKSIEQVEILINDVPLIEIVREQELPYAEKEFDDCLAEGEERENLGSRGWLAGDYIYLRPELVFLPSQNFFGEPYNHGFLVEPDDPVNFKSLILECTCGIAECWFLLAKISVEKSIVRWDDFQQFHRDWRYQLAFTFDRGTYEKAFSAASHSS